MRHTPLFRAVSTVAGAAALLVSAATPALAASKKGPTTQTPSITAGPAQGSFQATRTATFSFRDAATNASFQCKLDAAPAGTCKSPKSYTKLADGQHTFRLTATAPGKKPSATVTRTWTVDLHVPAPPVVSSSQSNPTNQTTRPFTFSGETGATFRCSLDAAAFTTCSTPFTTPAVADGGHVLAVKQVARNGLASAATSVGWDVDTTTPDRPVINSGPTGTVNTADNTFTFSEPSGGTTIFSCQVTPPGNTSDCSSGSYQTGALADGSYVFHVVAKDAAGNSSPEATRSYTVDTTHGLPDSPVITTHPAPLTKSTTGSFAFTGGTTCTLDGAPVNCPAGSYTTPVLGDGQHTFSVSNGTTSASYTWTIDTTPPAAPVFVAAPANGSHVNAKSQLIALASDGKSVLTCAVDGAAAVACPGFLQLSNLAEGVHTVVATATDAAGNTATATRSWTVDTVAPRAAFKLPSGLRSPVVTSFGEFVRGNPSTIVLVLTDTGVAVPTTRACVRGTTTVSCSATFSSVRLSPTGRLVAGQHYTVRVPARVVRDLAGNANAAATKAFRGVRSLQEDAPGATVKWQPLKTTSAFGGGLVREHLRGAAAAWSFTGTSVTWWTVKGANQGKAQMFVDGVLKKTVNNYASATRFHVARTVTGLSATRHTVRVVVLGLKGAKAGKGTFVSVDAFTVGKTLTASPALATSWRRPANSHFSAGRAVVTDLARSSYSISFRGVGVTWFTQRGPSQGKAQIWLDGVLKKTVDNYAASNSYGVPRSLTKLADKVHTLKIVVLGKHRAGARGSTVTVDRFFVA